MGEKERAIMQIAMYAYYRKRKDNNEKLRELELNNK